MTCQDLQQKGQRRIYHRQNKTKTNFIQNGRDPFLLDFQKFNLMTTINYYQLFFDQYQKLEGEPPLIADPYR